MAQRVASMIHEFANELRLERYELDGLEIQLPWRAYQALAAECCPGMTPLLIRMTVGGKRILVRQSPEVPASELSKPKDPA